MSHSTGNRRIGIGETPPMSDLTPANARPGNWFRPKPALFCRPPPVRLRLFSPPQTRRNCRARPEPWSGVPLARAAPPPGSGNPVPGPAFYGGIASLPPDRRCTAPSSPQAQGADDGQGVSPPPRRGALFVGLTVSDAGTRPRPTALMRGWWPAHATDAVDADRCSSFELPAVHEICAQRGSFRGAFARMRRRRPRPCNSFLTS